MLLEGRIQVDTAGLIGLPQGEEFLPQGGIRLRLRHLMGHDDGSQRDRQRNGSVNHDK